MQSIPMRYFSLMLLRVSLAGLLLWWGLAKAFGTGVGQKVSDTYYHGYFSIELLLVVFGWVQVVAAVCLAIGLFRLPFLVFQLLVNLFVAVTIWQSIADPFWMWMPGEKPETLNALFYPSAIVVAGCFLLLTMRGWDRWALDRMFSDT
ncbi:MAG: hypothetical protein AAF501_08065 [Pseudomonadota bacterium]